LLGALVASAFALPAAPAVAGPGDATRLEYARDAGAQSCPDRAALREAVRKRLGYDPFFPAARQAIVVEITSAGGGLRAELRLLDENGIIRGSRELHEQSPHCDELVASLALAISIALDPSAALDARPSDDEAQSNADAATTQQASDDDDAAAARTEHEQDGSASAAPAEKQPARSSRPRAHIEQPRATAHTGAIALRAAGFVALGSAPKPAAGLRLGAGYGVDWFSISAEFADQLAVSRAVSGGSARASLLSVSLVPCVTGRWAAACALVSVGSLMTEGEQVPAPFRQHTAQVNVGARLEYAPALSRSLRLLVDVDLLKPLVPVTLRLQSTDVWRTPFFSGAVGLGLEVQFP